MCNTLQICNFLWMMGTWGANYTSLDVILEQVFEISWPYLHAKNTPVMAVKRSLLVLLLGLSSNVLTLVHAIHGTIEEDDHSVRILL